MTVGQTLQLLSPLQQALKACNAGAVLTLTHEGDQAGRLVLEVTADTEIDLEPLFTVQHTGYQVANLLILKKPDGVKAFIALWLV
ncbi:hypothetical protein GCM10023187_47130 [Nibrella viscosa]|uniref:Uncharacterized protein n=1 Tax=Nibrella viscosa TaxID=1084524 RepID=A0ABP8KUT2_9BACT